MSCELRGNGTLIIVVLKARNLPNRRKLDKQNPYCITRIANIVDRTPAIARGGQTPEWNHESRFQLTSEINPLLKISVLDETKKSPVLIGDAEIDCSPVFNTTADEGYDKWHPLQYAGRTAGEIYVEMTFYPTAPIEAAKKKGAVTLHRNTVRPLPIRPGEESSFAELSDDESEFESETESFRSPRLSSFYDAVPTNQSLHSFHNSHQHDFLDDTIARRILRENPEKFEELLHRNPDLAHSIFGSVSGTDTSRYSRSPEASRYSRSPEASRYSRSPEASRYSRSPEASANSRSPETSRYSRFHEDPRYSEFSSQPSRFAHRKSQSLSPVRNKKSINASFDDLEKEVQTDWYRNNFGTSRYSQFQNPRKPQQPAFDPLKISTILPKLPEFDASRVGATTNSEHRMLHVPPVPPHKSVSSTSSGYSTASYDSKSSAYTSHSENSDYSREFQASPRKKPPLKEYYTDDIYSEIAPIPKSFEHSNSSKRSW